MKQTLKYLAPLMAVVLAGCAAMPSDPDLDKLTADITKASFRDEGQAKVDRLVQDDANRECSAADVAGKPIDEKLAKGIEAANLKTIKWPADGKFLGDWKEGEKIAQSGVGKQFSDDPARPAGGNCYACHQLSKEESAFGNIGPSLYHFGKLRGNTEAIQKYTFGKIYNAQAYAACTNMPRFGHNNILTEEQIKHVTALLLDPNSPVNK